MNYKKLSELIIYMSRGISPKYSEVGIPVINQKCIRNGQLVFQDVKFHNSNKTYPEDKILRIKDIVINSTGVGTLGRVARIAKLKKLTLADSHITIVRPDVRKVDPLYLYYVLRFNESAIIELATGSTGQTELSRAALSELSLPLIERRDQEYISKNLDYIDNKILVNNALSKTLEDIAQTIFKSWFIDFDPVKAKMNGEKPIGMDAETASLFPDSFEESELGLIPKGWSVSELNDLSTVKYGAPFASKLFNTSKHGIPLIRIRDLKTQTIELWTTENHSKAFKVAGGQLLIGMDGEFIPTIWFGEEALVNQRICIVEPKDHISNYFLYFQLLPIMRKIEHGSTGSTVIHLGKSDIDSIRIVNPSIEVSTRYKCLVEDLLNQIVTFKKQNNSLSKIRDGLLPRLISGELQIPEEMLAS